MGRKNIVFREILYRVIEKDEWYMTQKSIAETCKVSLDTANKVVKTLHNFKAVEKKPLGFRVVNLQKLLTYWACTRNMYKDITYVTYSPDPASKIERDLPKDAIFTAFSGYARKFAEAPAYNEVYIYADSGAVKRMYPKKDVSRPNIIVLAPDPHLRALSEDGVAPLPQIYVDLWQIGSPKAERILVDLDRVLKTKPIEKFREMVLQWRAEKQKKT
ncbi:MAG: hypothetical protein QXG10_04455 [Candidatus Hadarchaeales archaeon]